jgi:hypothetical protein
MPYISTILTRNRPTLAHLTLVGCCVLSPQVCLFLSTLNLKVISLEGLLIFEERDFSAFLRTQTNLESLQLGKMLLKSKSFEGIHELQKLNHLVFRDCHLENGGSSKELGRLPNLRVLEIVSRNNSPHWTPLFQVPNQIESVTLDYPNPSIFFSRMKDNFKKIRKLVFKNMNKLYGARLQLSNIWKMGSLRELSFIRCQFKDEDFLEPGTGQVSLASLRRKLKNTE